MTLTRYVNHGEGVKDGLDGVVGEVGEVVVGELEPLQRVKVNEAQRRDPFDAARGKKEMRRGRGQGGRSAGGYDASLQISVRMNTEHWALNRSKFSSDIFTASLTLFLSSVCKYYVDLFKKRLQACVILSLVSKI